MPYICLIGNPVYDRIKTKNEEKDKVLSGLITNAGVIIKMLGMDAGIVSKVGKNEHNDFLSKMQSYNIDIIDLQISDKKSTGFYLDYTVEGERTIKNIADAGKIEFKEIPQKVIDSDVVVLGPIMQEIYPADAMRLAENSKFLALDPQGFIRNVDDDGNITNSVPDFLYELFSKVSFLKVSDFEARIILNEDKVEESPLSPLNKGGINKVWLEDNPPTKQESPLTPLNKGGIKRGVDEMAIELAKFGSKIVAITLGENGSVIFSREDKKLIRIPAYKTKVVDATGAGDAYLAGFIVGYIKTGDIETAGLYASAVSSFIIEASGLTFNFSEKDVISRIRRIYE